MKHSLSRQHFSSARFFARQAADLEQVESPLSDDRLAAHRAYVIGAVISAVAALEASINELYLEARDGDMQILGSIDDRAINLMVQLWPDTERAPILEKYQRVLLFAERGRFNVGRASYQAADGLIRLRDNLVHYKPEWDDERGRHQTLQDRLKGRFALNPLTTSNLWFPHRCLSAGCADWAPRIAAEFMKEFCDRLGVPQRLS